jgi:hypothetical protein
MIAKSHKPGGSLVDAASVALVANDDGSLRLLLPPDGNALMSRFQVLLAAVAFRSTDPEWVADQIEFIVEVRRQLDALDDPQPRIGKDH